MIDTDSMVIASVNVQLGVSQKIYQLNSVHPFQVPRAKTRNLEKIHPVPKHSQGRSVLIVNEK